jgi:pimeloyl-ACP methyl ester carboxylesterase
MSKLELINNGVDAEATKPDILLLHGISAGAWMWEHGALPLFAREGYRAWAMSLSGHGNSPGDAGAHHFGLDHYAADLGEGLARIARPCVVIAHSLGGAVLQSYLARGGRPAGSVLLCSVPPYGLWRGSMEMFWRSPNLWREMANYSLFGLKNTSIAVLRDGLFPNGVDDETFDYLLERLQDESLLAMSGAMGWPPFAPPPLSQRNLLVIGGGEDRFVPPTDVRATAAYYGAAVHVIEGAGHMLMYEPAGKQAAQIVLDWLARLAVDGTQDAHPAASAVATRATA